MPDQDRFAGFATRLGRGGGSSPRARWCVEELRAHWLDLRAEALDRGKEPAAAEGWADAPLGDVIHSTEVLGQQQAPPAAASTAKR